MSRRGFVKATVVAGAAGLLAGLGATAKSLFAPPPVATGTVNEGFIYTAPSTVATTWYQSLYGQSALVSQWDQQVNKGVGLGAHALWRALFDETDKLIPGTGYPALIIRVPLDKVIKPPDLDPKITVGVEGFVVAFNTCVHLCCPPGFGETHPPLADDVTRGVAPQGPYPPTDVQFGVIHCPCHNSQYDPLRWEFWTQPTGVQYLAANWIWGPARRGLPLIPVKISGDQLVGLDTFSNWYKGYCGL